MIKNTDGNRDTNAYQGLRDAAGEISDISSIPGDHQAGAGEIQQRPFRLMVGICCLIAFTCYFGSYMRLPVVPLFASSLGIDTAQIGLINSAFFLMAGLLSLPLGAVSDRMGAKPMAATGLLILAGTSFLLYFSTHFFHFLLLYVLFGVGIAAFGPTMMSAVANFAPPTHLGRVYGWYTTALFCAMSLGPAAGGYAAREFGFQPVFLISGAIILGGFALTVGLFPGTRSREIGGTGQSLSGFPALFKNRSLMGCWAATLGGCFGLGMFITFLPLYAVEQGLPVSQIGLLFFYQGMFNALSRFPFGILSDRMSDRRILVVAGFIGIIASNIGFGMSARVIHFMMWAILLGISMGLAFTSVGALVAEAVSPGQRGLAMGGYNAAIFFGMMMSSASMGAVIEKADFSTGFFTAAVIVLIFSGVFYLLTADKS
ncbi:hypothetical protein D3OALGB2SA_5792 [Olavius algarvensis associated proteobacterium Delta 3]|nr:hypothetical protein D3OALGB2SA_5792 [Olavius algarvensis associated proteobacterium Delta 3]